MKIVLQVAAAFALLSVGVLAAVLSYDSHHLALQADKTLQDLDTALKIQNVNLSTTQAHLDSVLTDLDGTVSQLNQAAAEERAYWRKTSADSDKTVKALRLTVDRAAMLLDKTDKQLNTSLLPDLDREVILTSQSAQSAFGSLGHAADQVAFTVDDLPPIFENLREGTAQLALASGHANNILASGEHTAAYYDKKLTTPLSFARQVGNVLLDTGSKLGNIMAGFVKK
jgi:ABC-type transporter Mla subunit MlaD